VISPLQAVRAVMIVAEIPSEGASQRHSHPGEDFGYVLEGTIVLQVDGQSPTTLKTGDVFVFPLDESTKHGTSGRRRRECSIPTSSKRASLSSRPLGNRTYDSSGPSRFARKIVGAGFRPDQGRSDSATIEQDPSVPPDSAEPQTPSGNVTSAALAWRTVELAQ
jgi:hypothetical protein